MSSLSPAVAAALEALALIEESVLDWAPAVTATPRAIARARSAENISFEIERIIYSSTIGPYPDLSVNAALFDGVSHAIDGQHVGSNAIINIVQLSVAHNILERVHHDVFQLFVHH